MVAYKLVISGSLPQLSYLTRLDAFTLFASLCVCAVFVSDTLFASSDVALLLVAGIWASGSVYYAWLCCASYYALGAQGERD